MAFNDPPPDLLRLSSPSSTPSTPDRYRCTSDESLLTLITPTATGKRESRVTPLTPTSRSANPSPTRRIYNFLCLKFNNMTRVSKRALAKANKPPKVTEEDPDYDPSKDDRAEDEEYRYGANLMKIEAALLGKYLHETISGPRRGKSLELQIPMKDEEQDEEDEMITGIPSLSRTPTDDLFAASVHTTSAGKRPLDESGAVSPTIKRLKREESFESIMSSVQDTVPPDLRAEYFHVMTEPGSFGSSSPTGSRMGSPASSCSRVGSHLRTQSIPSPEMQIDGGVDFVAGGESSPDFSSSPWGLADLVEADEPSSKPTADGLATLIVNNEPLKPSRSRRKTQAKSRRKTRHYSPSDDEVYSSPSDDANGDESLDEYDMPRIKPNEKTGIVFDFSSERAKRWASAINLPGGLYNGEEQDLFFRLAMRGFEPLVPKDWRHDFPTLPESLYPPTSGPSFRPLFQVRRSSNLYATKALANLFSVGGRVRDCDIVRKRPEKLIKDAIKKYFRWAMFDADLHTTESKIPVHAIYAQKKGETTLQAVRRLNRRLRFLTSQYQKAFGVAEDPEDAASRPTKGHQQQQQLSETQTSRHFPLLIGFIICGPIVAIVTHTTDPQEIETSFDGKFISQFDLSERGQDVWNSLAIAIAVMHARRTMIGLAEEGLGGFTFCETAQPASDPDL